MSDKLTESEKNEEIVKALAGFSGTIKIGDTEYKIYPTPIAKIILLDEHLKNLAPIFDAVDVIKLGDDAKALAEWSEKLAAAGEHAVQAFHLLTSPNDPDNPPQPLTSEQVKRLQWMITPTDILEILVILKVQSNYASLLKKDRAPRQEVETTKAGGLSSVGSSN